MRSLKLLLPLLLSALMVDNCLAIPAFARKYDTSCLTCHTPFPRLKAYGEEYAANGFQLPDREAPRFTRETGDSSLLLMRELPFALRLQGFVSWEPQATGQSEVQSPSVLKLLSGGQIARDVSYYFYFFFSEMGSVAGLEDAFIMFNNVFRSEIDFSVGQFQVSDPLFKRELRMTLEDYMIYRAKVGSSSVNLTYDRGIMLNRGFASGTDVVLEVVNGAGIGPAEGEHGFDNDKYKNVMLRVSQDIGDVVRIGGFGYFGNEEKNDQKSRVWLAGPDLTLSADPVEVNFQYVERRDENPYFQPASSRPHDGDVKTRGLFGELVYTPNGDESSWYGTLLYNWVDSQQEDLDYNAATAHFSYMLARNLRLVGEYTYSFKTDEQPAANRISVGFVTAF
jgi:hypothetical protein